MKETVSIQVNRKTKEVRFSLSGSEYTVSADEARLIGMALVEAAGMANPDANGQE